MAGLAILLLLFPACSGAGTDTSAGIPAIVQGSDDPSLPYGIVAIDYHFHDAHPSIPIAPSRDVTFTNEGSVLHNVTFPELGFSKDLPIGSTFTMRRLGEKLGGTGTYTFYCKYHNDAYGMAGTIVIS